MKNKIEIRKNGVEIENHGWYEFATSNKYKSLKKAQLIDLVLDIYDGHEIKKYSTKSYWLTFPKIALLAIVEDCFSPDDIEKVKVVKETKDGKKTESIMKNKIEITENIEHKQDGNNRRRMVVNGVTLGWITKWYKRDSLNHTGIKMYSAKPIGLSAVRHDCETYKSAEAYILGYHETSN